MSHNSIFATQISDRTIANEAYSWRRDALDGSRSFSIPGTIIGYNHLDWAYSIPTGTQNSNSIDLYTTSTTGKSYQKYSNLYNWRAATAGSGTILLGDNYTAPDSICPKGWKLPYRSLPPGDHFNLLVTFYNLTTGNTQANNISYNKAQTFPLHLMRAGTYGSTNGILHGRSEVSMWWGDTYKMYASEYGQYQATTLHMGTVGVLYPTSSNMVGTGYSIRCRAR